MVHIPGPKGSVCNALFEEFLTLLFRFLVDSLRPFKNNLSIPGMFFEIKAND